MSASVLSLVLKWSGILLESFVSAGSICVVGSNRSYLVIIRDELRSMSATMDGVWNRSIFK